MARRYMSIPDAADYLGVHPETIRRMIARGELTGYRARGAKNRLIRVDGDEIDAAMQPIPTVGTIGHARRR